MPSAGPFRPVPGHMSHHMYLLAALQAVTRSQKDSVRPFCTQHGRSCGDRGSHIYWTLGGARWALRQQGGPFSPSDLAEKGGTCSGLPAAASIMPWSEEFN